MHRRWSVGLTVVLLVLAGAGTFPVSGASGSDAGVAPDSDTPQLGSPDGFNDTEFRLTVFENGTTRWTISHYRFLGDNQSRIEQFESFATTFNSSETATYSDFKTRASALTSFGTEATNREMNATGFSKAAYIEQQFRGQVGVLEMSFDWTNFARTTEHGVVIDDVFEGGMYIGPGQSLVVHRPDTLVFETATPTPDALETENNLTASATLEYRGEQDFNDQRPKLVLVAPDTLGETQSTGTTTATPAATAANSSNFGTLPLVVAILLLLAVAGAIAWYSGNLGTILRDEDGDDGEATANSAAEPSSPPEPETPVEPTVPDEELLSDEDQVLNLLEENGGRMKQVNIVENTDWSKSKVSMLLSDMEEEGQISKLRVGRENIISKAGEEPDAVGSPFDDE